MRSHRDTFQATDPNKNETLPAEFPVSSWEDCDAALDAAVGSRTRVEKRCRPARSLTSWNATPIASTLRKKNWSKPPSLKRDSPAAHGSAMWSCPAPATNCGRRRRLADAADWALATIDTKAGIRSCYGPLGPVCVFGPNNFPFAFGSAAGGDFAAAIAAGNPVIAKANSSHPETTRLFAREAAEALQETGLPAATVQLIYRTSHADGERLVADPRIGATGYTGSRSAGLKLKAAADRAGKPIYLELSSVNPVVITPAALAERSDAIVGEFITSVLMGTGQFCTNPGVVLLLKDTASEAFIDAVKDKFSSTAAGTLLSPGGCDFAGRQRRKTCVTSVRSC